MSSDTSPADDASSVELELYFLIARFLASGPCQKAYQALRQELDENKLLPKRIDWEGQEHVRSYENLCHINRHIGPSHLLQVCKRIGPLLDKEFPPCVKGVLSLLGAGRQSALRTEKDVQDVRWLGPTFAALHHGEPLLPPNNLTRIPAIPSIVHAREFGGKAKKVHCHPPSQWSRLTQLSRSLCHLSAVYCVAFDRTGSYVFTGADDALVKIWSSSTGRLLATLRGHSAEITDMAVNYENTLLATGSCDKIVRVWNLKTTAPVAVLHGHTGMITMLQFCPLVRGEKRFLASTGGDGCVCFWEWNVRTSKFSPKPIKFIERSRAGTQMLCQSFSPGGLFLATGGSDHVVRVFSLATAVPEKICELEAHTDNVDSIEYSHRSSRFVTGSKDGTARIWRYERQQWKAIVLHMTQELPGTQAVAPAVPKQEQPKVTMVSWSADDNRLTTAVTDCSIKIWDSNSGALLYVLKGHEDEVYVLEHNPTYPHLLLSAGHDGHIIVWDTSPAAGGVILKNHFNTIQGQGHGAVFDCKWSSDGLKFASTDSHGFLMLFGYGGSEKFKALPEQVFFHTDYRPLIRDANNYVLDEQTQQPPHLMAPPFLVDMDGNPYPPKLQRLVPGREHCADDFLVPHMGVAPSGDREVQDPDLLNAEEQPENPPQLAQPQVEEAREESQDDRIIDHMIERMQREQDERIVAAGGQPLLSPSREEPPPFRPMRPSLDGGGRSGSPERPAPTSPQPGTSQQDETSQDSSQAASSARSASPQPGTSSQGERDSVSPQPGTPQQADRENSQDSQPSTSSAAPNMAVWNTRVCVTPLQEAIVRHKEKLVQELGEAELRVYASEKKRRPLLPSESESSDQASDAAVQPKKKPRRPNEQMGVNRLTTRALYDTEEEEEEEMETDEAELDEDDNMWHSGSSENESSEYSDWAADAADGGTTLQPPKRKSQRQPKKRKLSSSEEESNEEESDGQRSKSSTEVKRKRPPPTKKKKVPTATLR